MDNTTRRNMRIDATTQEMNKMYNKPATKYILPPVELMELEITVAAVLEIAKVTGEYSVKLAQIAAWLRTNGDLTAAHAAMDALQTDFEARIDAIHIPAINSIKELGANGN